MNVIRYSFPVLLCFLMMAVLASCGPDAGELNTEGLEKLKQKDFDGAFEDFTTAIDKDPEFAEAYLNRGFVHGNRGELEDALADFNKAIELDPDYLEAYFGFTEEFKPSPSSTQLLLGKMTT
ncbi:tetratricopeptide repeat protein [Prosthecochloris sp. ZM_2]|uniref:tetratricopeptide repeat protein n=1 Tax=Prosthecochloris sp. ZM_2 TaxID=2045206 RepID=UPI000DF7D277|nr:tetratricopeptide repeat protein [Prosthecochloris sp. ZM_2]RNA67381.1 tetratricopeptide repeat protein [Prosthecochloris sp. ZM_2]